MSCFTCLKVLVTIVNLMIMMIGMCIVGLCLSIQLGLPYLLNMNAPGNYILYVMMAMGAAMIILGLIGCCGGCLESQCMLGLFFSAMLLVVVGQLGFLSFAYTRRISIVWNFSSAFKYNISQYYSSSNVTKSGIDVLQKKLECCGASRDLVPSSIFHTPYYIVPASCCKSSCDGPVKIESYNNPFKIYEEECSTKILDLLKEYQVIPLVTIIVTGLLEICSLIFSMLLCLTVRKLDQYLP